MKTDTYCDQHPFIDLRLKFIEEKINKMDTRIWGIVTLLIVNLAGVIGILLSNI